MAAGGWAVMSLTFAPTAVVVSAGFGGIYGYLLGGGLILFGLCAWFAPRTRHLAGFLGVLFAVASLVASNLGGFLVGMLLGVLGGSMTFGWGPKRDRVSDSDGADPNGAGSGTAGSGAAGSGAAGSDGVEPEGAEAVTADPAGAGAA
ncbi:hypothetical protein Acsp05_53520 [Actinokineospora sp. NBRC 105648]|nr:hypothetical protein Acsp05_53520 [Actinokineospora sp. NBRC 105648]